MRKSDRTKLSYLQDKLDGSIDDFLEAATGKSLTVEQLVVLFKPVQNNINNLNEKAEDQESDIEDLKDQEDADTWNIGKGKLFIRSKGLSNYADEAVTLFCEALAKDEIETNNILNAFYIL